MDNSKVLSPRGQRKVATKRMQTQLAITVQTKGAISPAAREHTPITAKANTTAHTDMMLVSTAAMAKRGKEILVARKVKNLSGWTAAMILRVTTVAKKEMGNSRVEMTDLQVVLQKALAVKTLKAVRER